MSTLNKSLFSISLALAFSLPLAKAELVRQDVQEPMITSEAEESIAAAPAQDEEVIMVRRRPQISNLSRDIKMPPRKIVYQEEAAPVAAPAPGIGGSIDKAIDKKLEVTRKKMEDSLIKAVEGIKINIGDDQPAPAAPVATTVVVDKVVTSAAAPVAAAPIPTLEEAPISEAKAEDSEEIKGKVSVVPMIGTSSLSNNTYNVNARYSAGLGVEVDVAENITFMGSYTYSQYDIGLANNSQYYNYYNVYNPMMLGANNLQQLEYNQNVIDASMRYYLLPKTSRYRVFAGAGMGYSRAYLNYKQKTLNTFSGNQYYVSGNQLDDYEVNSFLGLIEAGAEIQISKKFSVGANFKYHTVLSAKENAPLNNNAFITNAYGTVGSGEKNVVGGSIKDNGFYTILGTVKVSF